MGRMPTKYFAEAEKMISETFLNKGIVLSEFLTKRILGYNERPRKGTCRGTILGPTKKKILAAFLAALGNNPVDVYRRLILARGSYSGIRHWFAEPEFKKLVLQFQDEIADRFIDRLVELSKTTDTNTWDLEPAYIFEHFGSAKDYGPELTDKIFLTITDRLNESKSLLLLWIAHLVIRAFSPKDEGGEGLDRALGSFLKIHVLAFASHAIKNPEIRLRLSPVEQRQYSRMLEGYALDEVGRGLFLGPDQVGNLFSNDSWISDGLRFTEKVAYSRNGQIIRKKSRRGRPPKKGDRSSTGTR